MQTNHNSEEWKGYTLVLLYCSIGALFYLGIEYVFMKYPEISAIEMAFWGDLLTAIIVAPFLLSKASMRTEIQKDIQHNGFLFLLFLGGLTGIGTLFLFWAFKTTSAEVLSVYNNSEILFGILLGIFWLQEKYSFLQWTGAGLAIGGFIVFSNASLGFSSWAIVLVCIGQFFYALQSALIKKYKKQLGDYSFPFLRLNAMWITIFPFYIWEGGSIPPIPAIILISILFISATYFSRVFLYQSFKYISLANASVWYLWETIFIIAGSYVFFSPVTTPMKIIGIVCILGGIYLVQKKT